MPHIPTVQANDFEILICIIWMPDVSYALTYIRILKTYQSMMLCSILVNSVARNCWNSVLSELTGELELQNIFQYLPNYLYTHRIQYMNSRAGGGPGTFFETHGNHLP